MTIKEAAEQILGKEAVWDSALPQTWCDRLQQTLGIPYHKVCWDYVWAYDGRYTINGRPCALTAKANLQLADSRSSYPLTPNPIEE